VTPIKKLINNFFGGGASTGERKHLMMPMVLNILHNSHVIVVLSQLLLVAQAVIPVTQILVSGERKLQNKNKL